MSDRLAGKVAIVTGSTLGIGAATARLFAQHGAKVVLNCHRDDEAAQRIQEELAPSGAIFVEADVSDSSAVSAMVKRALVTFGRVDVLVNNAGRNFFNDPLALTEDDWRRCMSVDLEGAWHCAKAVLPTMLAQGAGSIVNIASVHGHKIVPGCFPYPVAKHALIGLTRSIARDFGPQGVRANAVCPGWVRTPMADGEMDQFAATAGFTGGREEGYRRVTADVPLRRPAEPGEIAAIVRFLGSAESSYITGAVIVADGGAHAVDLPTLAFDRAGV